MKCDWCRAKEPTRVIDMNTGKSYDPYEYIGKDGLMVCDECDKEES